jgi:hypothetical protein
VLQLSKQQKPQNSEAFTWIIAEATKPICKQSNADAPKPPTYLFINSNFKELSSDKISDGR